MNARTRRSGRKSAARMAETDADMDTMPPRTPTVADDGEAVPASAAYDDGAPPVLPLATPLRRTRSQTKREQEEALANGTPLPDEAIFHTPPPSARKRRGSILHTISPKLRQLGDRSAAAIDSVAQSCTRYQLLAYEALPDWMKDNAYIRAGYRANIGWRHSVESVCHLHNETVNVWSHLIAFLVMTVLLILTMNVLSPHGADRMDLDVILEPRPLCDTTNGVVDPLCQTLTTTPTTTAPAALPQAATPAVPSLSASITAGQDPDDPLVLLHRLLGDNQDEMLAELLSRAQTHVPSLRHLTSTLREKAASIQAALLAAVPDNDATRHLAQLKDETSLTFSEYVAGVEHRLDLIRDTVADLLQSEKAQAASSRMAEEYGKLKHRLSEFVRDFTPDVLSAATATHVDVLKVTRNLMSRFLDQTHLSAGLTLSPTLVAMPGVKVRVKPIVESMPGAVFARPSGLLEDAYGDLAHQLSDASVPQIALIEKGEHSTRTIDPDGRGQTTSTAIGYMTIDVHTSASQPGTVQLQLHSYLPRYPLGIFIITAMLCLSFSSAYHLLHAVSDVWANRFQSLDYAGIVLLIAGSTHPVIYYSFYCAPRLKWLYIAIVWTLAIFVFLIVILPTYRHLKYRGLKVACFIALGFSGCVPLAHFCWHLGSVHFIFGFLVVMGACYLTGAAIYLAQVPERWWPGYFDYFFSSHQLWHLSIFAAVLVHYCGLMHLYEWRMTRICTAGMWC